VIAMTNVTDVRDVTTGEVLIVGGGRIGSYLATLLVDAGRTVTLIESEADRIAHLREVVRGARVVHGSGSDPDVLESAGIRRAGTVVTATNRDETNLVITSLAKFEFGVGRTIGRVNNPKNAWLYTHEMGVDVALNQADIIGHLAVEEMSLGEMMTLLKLRRGQVALVEEQVHPASAAVGRAIVDLPVPGSCVVVAVIRGTDLLTPRGTTVLQSGDEVLAVVHSDDAPTLAALLGPT
jgi:trk system potassium uptake protein TrkA